MTTVILNDDEKETMKVLANALKPFRLIRDTMSIQSIELFLAVAIKEDRTINELASATGVAPPMVSRLASDMGDVNRYHQPGYDLVDTRPDIMDRRYNRTRLTPKGKALAGQVLKAMGSS
jgi:DNA-binding MarR family transcriptional regulator